MEWTILIGSVATLSGIILGWLSRARSVRKDFETEAGRDGYLRADVEHMKRGLDDLLREHRIRGQQLDALIERVTRVEESNKQTDRRLDRLDGRRQ
ncbi:hypothetical protein [Paenibacillus humicola]|uniref:hypothetical protein n=1 Tax=Paenibacillus humicola TaxID=3110540 RepID=UPI00237BC35C|nr:hypothetical protein [Paenibacillus humicola]